MGYTYNQYRLDLEIENLMNRRVREGEYHYASDWPRYRQGPAASQLPAIHYIAGAPFNARLTATVVF